MSEITTYGVDTVALLAYFANKLNQDENQIFLEAEENRVKLLIPSIVIGEMLYIILKGKEIFGKRIPQDKIELILTTLYQSTSFIIISLNYDGWNHFLQSSISELHDRIIVATCLQEGINVLISSDTGIIDSGEITTIW